MAVIRKYNPGEYCWSDLGTTDVASAKKFYRGIFGWKIKDFPMGMGDAKYSIATVDGKDAGAFYPMSDDQKKMKAPPFWLPYISVKSVDGTVKKAKAAGGKVCSKPVDVMDVGRMAILQDPTGAAFAIWQAGRRKGAGLDGKPGTVCWHDLNTPKPAAAGKFYTKVFGWKTTGEEFGGNTYHLFKLGKVGVCGMWPAPMKKLPPSWVTYWQVADCAKSVTKVKRLGGRVLMGTTPVPGMCRFAIVSDPQGATFGILAPED
jgi:predicted enzyme related to lactoylglutathione lyase